MLLDKKPNFEFQKNALVSSLRSGHFFMFTAVGINSGHPARIGHNNLSFS